MDSTFGACRHFCTLIVTPALTLIIGNKFSCALHNGINKLEANNHHRWRCATYYYK